MHAYRAIMLQATRLVQVTPSIHCQTKRVFVRIYKRLCVLIEHSFIAVALTLKWKVKRTSRMNLQFRRKPPLLKRENMRITVKWSAIGLPRDLQRSFTEIAVRPVI